MCSDIIDTKAQRNLSTDSSVSNSCELEADFISNSIAKVLKVVIKRFLRTIKSLLFIKI